MTNGKISSNDCTYRRIDVDRDEQLYRASCALRERVLRLPLGLTLSATDTGEDTNQFHYVAIDDTRGVIGVVIGRPNPTAANTVQIRQMAIDPACQGIGIGRRLLAYAEHDLARRGLTDAWMEARLVALPFYQQCGWSPQGKIYEHLDIDHRYMVKMLVAR